MVRQTLIDDIVPSSKQIFDLIVKAEKHKKIVWTAGRVLGEAALLKRVRGLDYDERKMVLKRIAGILDEFAVKGALAASSRAAVHRLPERGWIRLHFPQERVVSVMGCFR